MPIFAEHRRIPINGGPDELLDKIECDLNDLGETSLHDYAQKCLENYFKNDGLGLEPKDNFGSGRGTVRGGPPNAELIVIVGEGGEILYRYDLRDMGREQRTVI